jgi:hypothetical protein
MTELYINKFKINEHEVTMVYEKNKIKITKEFTRRYENITKDLQKAIDKMKYHLLDICMSEFVSAKTLDNKIYLENWQLLRVRFYGITFTFYDKSLNGAVISGGYELLNSSGVINLNTPHRIINHYGDAGNDGQLMSMEMIVDVQKLYEQVESYLAGNRVEQQPKLEGLSLSIEDMREAIRGKLKLANYDCDNLLLKYEPMIDVMDDDHIKSLHAECFPEELESKPKKKLKAKISKCLSISAEQIEITASLDEVAS